MCLNRVAPNKLDMVQKHLQNTIVMFLITLMGSACLAQNTEVEVISDPRLDSLVRIQANSTLMMKPGYRVQLTTERSKKEIDKVRTQFILAYPYIPTYVFFLSPNYILKVGDFERKEDALDFHDQLTNYPFSFIKKEMVNYN